jgi:IMP dehydrogenase
VKDVMDEVVVSVDPETTIEESKELMNSYSIDYLPIIENDKLIGIFTKKDLKRVIKKQT